MQAQYHVKNVSPEAFDAFVREHPNGLVFQTAGYNRAMLTHGFTKSDYLALADAEGNIAAGSAFYMKPLPKPFHFFYYAIAKHAFTVDYENQALFEKLLEETRAYLSKQGVILLTFDLPVDEGHEDFYRRLEALGCETKVFDKVNNNNIIYRHNSVLDLDGDIKQILKRMKGNSRRAMNKTLDFGYEIETAGMERFDEFYDLLNIAAERGDFEIDDRESMRHKVAGILDIPGTEMWFVRLHGEKTAEFYRGEREKALKVIRREEKKNHPNENRLREERNFLASTERSIEEMEALSKEHPEGIVLSGCMIADVGQKITYMYAGSKDDYRNYFPNYHMIYKMIERSVEKGYEVLDLSGTQSDENPGGLASFKLSLGARTLAFSGDIQMVCKKPWGNLFKKLLQKRREKQYEDE